MRFDGCDQDINGGEILHSLKAPWLLSLIKVYECLQTFLSDSPAPALDYASGLSLQLLIDIRSLPGCSEEANELYRLLRQPHLQALLSAHDTVAQKDYEPVLPPMPDELPEEEEATRTVCLVKNKQPLLRIKSRLVSGQRVPGSDLTAYRSYCVTALLIRHKLPKEAVVEFQSSLQRHRKPPPQTSEAGPSSPSFRPTTFPDHVAVLNILLEDFKELQEGLEPAPKLINNVQSKLHRIRQFVGWMSHGNTNLGKLLFLGNMGRLRGWVKSLRTNMIKTNLRRVVRELKASIKSWVRPVVLHQIRVKGKKDATMHSMKELQECRRLALVAIPKLLSQLEKHHTYLDQCSLFGYVTAYLASLYGHRLGVFLNLTDEQVSQAVYEPEGNDYLIKEVGDWCKNIKVCVSQHNLLIGKEPDKIPEARLVGHEVEGRSDLQQSEERGGDLCQRQTRETLPGAENFGAPYVPRHGHDTATSDKFYTMDLTMEQARRGRLLFEQAQKEGEESVTGTKKEKGCRVMLFPLKMSPQKPLRMSPQKPLRMSPQKPLRMSPQKSLRMSPQKLTQIIRVRRNRMAELRRK
ncbi:hypothetical protein KUCAC02_001221 [Chaenocephalus aceratus]|uniref:Uncharacterized protein n=1 Tax=Chaenocephalus aceratus TaxID=36190 RepID=A0ACB9XVP3_CHAAC|nr:hypothetical protein KUCAC02_001221 [Chaenocephalus aceratus]